MKQFLWTLCFLPLLGQAQRIEYAWPNTPCPNLLNCDSGCTACASPVNSGAGFFGNALALLGADVCPHTQGGGDNALLTYGWTTLPDEGYGLLITGIAFEPTQLDSIVLRHRAGTDGPTRLQVRFGINENMPTAQLADLPVPGEFGKTTFLHLGDVQAGPDMVYGYFSLLLQPYAGNGGSWDLDDIRIVGSPAVATPVPDLSIATIDAPLPKFDALGRPLVEKPGFRFYLDRSRRVVVP
jgi:hypothetical protein